MKYSMILLDQWIKDEGLQVLKVGDFHDEAQAEMEEKYVDRYKSLAVDSIRKSGEFFKLNVPLDGEAKSGNSWAETH